MTEHAIQQPLSAEDIWKLFQETSRQIQDTDRQLKATDEQIKATDRQMKATDRQMKATDRKIEQMSKNINALNGNWSYYTESIVAAACETIFLKRGIEAHIVSQRLKSRTKGYETDIDVLVENNQVAIAVEVKNRLGVSDVKDFLERLQNFKKSFPRYADYTVYGAVAGIAVDDNAGKHAYRCGLFVLTQSGETVRILNDDKFQPKVW